MGRKRRRQQNEDVDGQSEKKRQHLECEQLPEGAHHYDQVNELPVEIQQ